MAKSVKWDEAATVGQNARRKLPALAKEYFAQGRAVSRGKHSSAAVHRLQMRTRRFGYTLELFQSCYGPALAQRLAKLRRLEQLLEELHNCAAARRTWDERLPPRSPQRIRLQRVIDEREHRKLAEFRDCWTAEVDAKGQERAWRDYLARAR